MDTTQEIILSLLHNLGSRREIDQYLARFTGAAPARFAVIKVGGGIIEHHLDELAASLAFLRRIGLLPIVIHGGGPQLTAELALEGIESRFVDGLRVTSPEVLSVARRVLRTEGEKLAQALDVRSVRARPISSGVFVARELDPSRLGLVGEVTSVNMGPVEAALQAGVIPVVSCLGESEGGQILNVNADVAARELALSVRPFKIIFLTPTGGLLDEHGRVIPAVNLAEDYDTLVSEPWVTGGMLRKLQEIKLLLDALPESSSVSITTPEHIARELFTHTGRGTLVRRGVEIREQGTLDGIDKDRLGQLLEQSFGRRLHPWFIQEYTPSLVVLAGDYTACALVSQPDAAPYLDKFAVTGEAQGTGIGASIWNRVRARLPSLYWRTRTDNPINPWYLQRADGMHRGQDWLVFWYGLSDQGVIRRCVEHAMSVRASFAPVARGAEVEHAQ